MAGSFSATKASQFILVHGTAAGALISLNVAAL
jgi:hypothetical protein